MFCHHLVMVVGNVSFLDDPNIIRGRIPFATRHYLFIHPQTITLKNNLSKWKSKT
jgi:hypothetical protein